jgi:hypothetical protein
MPRHPTPPLSLSLLSLCPSPKQDLAAVPTREGKMRRAAQIGRVLVDEAMGVFKVIPYGIRAMRQHRRLPDARVVLGASDDACAGVSIVRDVRYAAADRAVMDIYLPPGVQLSDEVALGDRIAAAAADAAADADAVTTASCSGGGSSSASAREVERERGCPWRSSCTAACGLRARSGSSHPWRPAWPRKAWWGPRTSYESSLPVA